MEYNDKDRLLELLDSYKKKIEEDTLDRDSLLLLTQLWVSTKLLKEGKVSNSDETELAKYAFLGAYIYSNIKS